MAVSLTVVLVPVVLCLFVLKSLWSALKARKYPAPLPPGPPRHWLLGNLPDLPSPASRPWETYSRWFAEYGMSLILPFFTTCIGDVYPSYLQATSSSWIFLLNPSFSLVQPKLQRVSWTADRTSTQIDPVPSWQNCNASKLPLLVLMAD